LDVFPCDQNDEDAWLDYKDLRINFSKKAYSRLSRDLLPSRETFPPNVESPNTPPEPPENVVQGKGGAKLLAQSIATLSQSLTTTVQNRGTPSSATFMSPVANGPNYDVVVSFEFTREEPSDGSQYKCTVMVDDMGMLMKNVLKLAWDHDKEFPSGTFSGISDDEMKKINKDNSMEMMFTVPKLGAQHCLAFSKLSVEKVLKVVGPDIRPVPVKIELVEAKKPAAIQREMPANLFG
jgi:hypothetical protein